MTMKILCVDDDPNILAGYQRTLRKQFNIETALGPEQGLDALKSQEPFAVIVSDMNMPGMNGVQFLIKAQEKAPDCVRIMLTGNTDLKTAESAVNQGHVFRFLSKPCPPETLAIALNAGVRQYNLIIAERELLEKTLNGSIKVLMDILSAVDPRAFGRANVLKDYTRTFAAAFGIKPSQMWELEASAMLAPVGLVTIPPSVIHKSLAGNVLTKTERSMLERVPEIGSNLLANIPRLEPVAKNILYQNKRFDGSGFPQDSVAGEEIPVGARILKVLSDLVDFEAAGTPKFKALEQMRQQSGGYDPRVLDAACRRFEDYVEDMKSSERPRQAVKLMDLQVGQVLVSEVKTTSGMLIVTAGTKVSPTLLERLCNFANLSGIEQPIYVEG